MVKTTPQILKNGQVDFVLTISTKDVKAEYARLVQNYQKTAEIKGFRKGKAPLALVEKSLDKNQVYALVLENLFPTIYAAKIKEMQLSPLIDPVLKPKQFEEDKDWIFEVTTVVKPEVELGDYRKYLAKALADFAKNQNKTNPSSDSKNHPHKTDDQLTIIFDTLLKEAKIEVAPLLVEQETKSQLSRLVSQLQQLRLTVADFAKSQKRTQEELVAEYRKVAETNLKLELILDKLVAVENPAVEEEEIQKLKPPKGQESYAKYVIQKQKVLDLLKKL